MGLGLRGKLLAAFGTVLGLFAITAVVSTMALSALAGDLDDMYVEHLEPLNDVSKAVLILERINTSLEESINAGSPQERESDLKAISGLTADLDRILAEYRGDQQGGDPTIVQTLAAFDKSYASFAVTEAA
jgi:hypothetical protein